MFLAVGGIEPRKGSVHLLEAMGKLGPGAMLAVVGGHSFQDYTAYRDAALARLPDLGLELGRDVVLVGTVADDELRAWYHAADALAFPSLKEGWGLAVLEAMAAGLPVVATDIPVFREYLTPGVDALLVPPADPAALAGAMADADGRRRPPPGAWSRPAGGWRPASPGPMPPAATRRSTAPRSWPARRSPSATGSGLLPVPAGADGA